MKILLEIVSASQIKDIQKKLNQWKSTNLLIKFETQSLHNGDILFKILLKKEV